MPITLTGTLTVTESIPVNYLVVGAGGGAGTSYYSALSGGAAGLVVSGTAYFSTYLPSLISVGAGGVGTRYPSTPSNGGRSIFANFIATGGKAPDPSARRNMGLGGSNGVGGDNDLYLGGNDNLAGNAGGGGAGANANGGNSAISIGGAGGTGVISTILGASNSYGVGGTGGSWNAGATNGANGGANTGNGGSGGNSDGLQTPTLGTNGNGGSGVVIIQIPASRTATFTGVCSVSTPSVAGYKTYVVTATTGTVTVTFS